MDDKTYNPHPQVRIANILEKIERHLAKLVSQPEERKVIVVKRKI